MKTFLYEIIIVSIETHVIFTNTQIIYPNTLSYISPLKHAVITNAQILCLNTHTLSPLNTSYLHKHTLCPNTRCIFSIETHAVFTNTQSLCQNRHFLSREIHSVHFLSREIDSLSAQKNTISDREIHLSSVQTFTLYPLKLVYVTRYSTMCDHLPPPLSAVTESCLQHAYNNAMKRSGLEKWHGNLLGFAPA